MTLKTVPTDEEIREMARERVAFKRHALMYVLVNFVLAGVWFVTRYESHEGYRFYWPLWVHLGWGIGLASHALGVYRARAWEAREEARLRVKLGRAP